ncbi:helix-turn-helix domain-containing protein [Actinomyces urogenitalis]|uniref:helix-turn-helix domain-containing protein n=1 Tax=Actinomyces urogenitalis TaxID=103621 RepID=UPI003C6CA5B4
MTQAQLAEVLGVRKSAVNAVFRGNGNLRIDTLAQYLAAMGRRLDVGAVPVPARRQRVMWSASLRGRVVAGRYDDRASRRKRDGGRYVVDLHTGRKANV